MNDLLNLLASKVREFREWNREEPDALRRLLESVDEDLGLDLPESPSDLDAAESLVNLAERSPLGLGGLKAYLRKFPPEKVPDLYEIVEAMRGNGSLD